MPPHPRVSHVPALDGLRGFAVIAVVMFHALLPGFRGGFIGVDVFFVLSGFLITSILIRELNAVARIDFARFYRHRAFRILPALLAALAGFVVFARWRGLSGMSILREVGPPLLFSTNWFRAAGYRFPVYFAHTWSLSIEEQFYLVWPVLVIVLWRVAKRRWCIAAVLGAALLVECSRAYLGWTGGSTDALYNRTDLRCDGLLVGAALAFAWSAGAAGFPRRAALAISACWPLAACLLIYICIAQTATARWMLLFGYSAAAISSGVLIHAIMADRSRFLIAILSLWPLRAIGAVSYGLYIYHWVIFTAFYYCGVSQWRSYIGIPLSLALAIVSYFVLERPMLRLRRSLDQRNMPDKPSGNADYQAPSLTRSA